MMRVVVFVSGVDGQDRCVAEAVITNQTVEAFADRANYQVDIGSIDWGHGTTKVGGYAHEVVRWANPLQFVGEVLNRITWMLPDRDRLLSEVLREAEGRRNVVESPGVETQTISGRRIPPRGTKANTQQEASAQLTLPRES